MFRKLRESGKDHHKRAQFSDGSVMAVVFLAMTTTVFLGMVLFLLGLSPGNEFSFTIGTIESLEFWRILTAPFSTFAPVAEDTGGASAALLASFLLYCACSGGLMTSGGMVERRLGTNFLLGFIGITIVMQSITSLFVFGFEASFSPVAITLGLLTLGLLVEFERPEEGRETMIDARLVAMAFILLPVLVASAFEPAFKPMLAGLTVGPICAICAFASKRKGEGTHLRQRILQVEIAIEEPEENFDLMPLDELKVRADDLLERVASEGMDSLDEDQKRLLTYVSQRLRGTRKALGEPDASDDPPAPTA